MSSLKRVVILSLIILSLAFAGCQNKDENRVTEKESANVLHPVSTPAADKLEEETNQTLPEYSDIVEIMQLLKELEELDNVSFEI